MASNNQQIGFIDRIRMMLRALLIRIVWLLIGCTALIISMQINVNGGTQILNGLFSPASPTAFVVSVARLATPAVGLWLIYRGLR